MSDTPVDWFTIQSALELAIRTTDHNLATMAPLTPASDAEYRELLERERERYRAALNTIHGRWKTGQ